MIPRISRTPITMKTKTQAGKGRTIPLADTHSAKRGREGGRYYMHIMYISNTVFQY